MRSLGARFSGLGGGPLTRHDLKNLIAIEQKKATSLLWLQAVSLLTLSSFIFLAAAFVMVSDFYNTSIPFSKRSWVQIKNLTPVVTVETRVNGVLEEIFASQGQLVQKGALLGTIETSSIKLDYEDTQQNFADKIVELNCLTSLQSNKSVFELPYDAQILVDQVVNKSGILYRVKQCERELLRNMNADQSLEETIAALEDLTRLLENIIKINTLPEITPSRNAPIALRVQGGQKPSDKNNPSLFAQANHDQIYPIMQLAQVRRELQKTRKEYFLRKLQKDEELGTAIKQTTQDLHDLDKQLRALRKQLDDNFIYASITGTIVGFDSAKVGTYFKGHDTVFELQPVENAFQISVAIAEKDSARFKIGTPITISLEKTAAQLNMITAAVVRKPNGTLEAVMNAKENAKENAKVILAAGYRGEGEQRIFANITTGQRKAWHSIRNIIFKNTAIGSI